MENNILLYHKVFGIRKQIDGEGISKLYAKIFDPTGILLRCKKTRVSFEAFNYVLSYCCV